jgi:hypothetical protein
MQLELNDRNNTGLVDASRIATGKTQTVLCDRHTVHEGQMSSCLGKAWSRDFIQCVSKTQLQLLSLKVAMPLAFLLSPDRSSSTQRHSPVCLS